MLDNLRNQTSFQPDAEEIPESFEPETPKKKQRPAPRKPRNLDQITRMKASQRFMVAFMLAIMVCLLGMTLLVLTGKMVLPVGF